METRGGSLDGWGCSASLGMATGRERSMMGWLYSTVVRLSLDAEAIMVCFSVQ